MNWRLLIAGACAALLASGAGAQMVTAKDPSSVIKALQAAGYKAELSKVDSDGSPLIRSASSGSNFSIYFYGCEQARNCATVQFHTAYDQKDGETSLTEINDWNRNNRFGRAYLDKDGDPAIEMDVDLDDGGLSQALFTDNLEFWTSVMAGFEKHIGW